MKFSNYATNIIENLAYRIGVFVQWEDEQWEYRFTNQDDRDARFRTPDENSCLSCNKRTEAYYESVTIGAGARLYQKTKNADGIPAQKRAVAEGIEAMRIVLDGEGGRSMVKLQYARKLKNVTIAGE